MDVQIKDDALDHIKFYIASTFNDDVPFEVKYNPQNKFYYLIVGNNITPIPIDINSGNPINRTYEEMTGFKDDDSVYNDIEVIRSSSYIPDDIFDVNYLVRSGVKGQRKGHRNYQSYEVKPTRSGMVGEEHGEAKAQSDRYYKNLHNRENKNFNRDRDNRNNRNNHNNNYNRNNHREFQNGINDQYSRELEQLRKERNDKPKSTLGLISDSVKQFKKENDKRKRYKQLEQIEKLREKNEKLKLKNELARIKAEVKKNKNYKQYNMLPKDYADKRKSLIADSPREVMRKWKGKLDNNDLDYLKRRMNLESDINRYINPPFDWNKFKSGMYMLSNAARTGNNALADIFNTAYAKEIASGEKKPWGYVGKGADKKNNKFYNDYKNYQKEQKIEQARQEKARKDQEKTERDQEKKEQEQFKKDKNDFINDVINRRRDIINSNKGMSKSDVEDLYDYWDAQDAVNLGYFDTYEDFEDAIDRRMSNKRKNRH